MNISKYLVIAVNMWQEMLTYRLSFAMWRIRTLLQLLTMYFLWLAVLPQDGMFLGYSRSLMLTYILGTSLITSIVLSSRSHEIGENINEGNLSNLLLKPINYFLYWFAKDIGDKAMNIVFSIVELTILFVLLSPPLFIQTQISYLVLFIIASILALLMYFLINVMLGLIGFWSPEVWAPRFIFTSIVTFFAGGLFPLDILPAQTFSFLKFLPFPYLLFFPLKIYLGQLSIGEILLGFTVSMLWIMILFKAVQFIWLKGLRVYTAQGR